MNWANLGYAIQQFCLWACTPANDDWPVVDEISQHLPRRIG